MTTPAAAVPPPTIRLPAGLRTLCALRLPRALGLLDRLYGATLATHGIAWVRTAGGIAWKLDLTDVTQRWCVYGDYEGPSQMRWIRGWLAGGGTVIDSGASIGQLVLHLAVLSGVRVIAFEPVPASAAWLRECLAVQPRWPVEVVEAALCDAPGTLELQVAGPHSTSRMDWYLEQRHPRISVPALRLDDYAQQHGLERIRLWKLDVEGAEPQALAGASTLLAQARIDAVLVEVSASTRGGVAATMSGHGYRPFTIARGGRLLPEPECAPEPGTRNVIYTLPRTGH